MPLPPSVQAWLERAGIPAAGERVEPLAGSTTGSVFALPRPGDTPDLVLKVYDPDRSEIDAAGLVRQEAAALEVAAGLDLPTAAVVAADATGAEAGVPVLAMTRQAGEVVPVPPHDWRSWVDGLAGVVRTVLAADLPAEGLGEYVPWHERTMQPPPWSTDDALWHEAASALAVDLPALPWRFIHRDLHPLNVLWADGRLSGVIDWANGCRGPIEVDIARCRVNLAMVDPADPPLALADAFTERCGVAYDRRWDITVVEGFLGNPDVLLTGNDLGASVTPTGIRAVLEATLRAALDG